MTIDKFTKKLGKDEKWPEEIKQYDSKYNQNEEYLEKIKLEYIQKVECERIDPFYDSVASSWMMFVRLDVYGQSSRVVLSDDSPSYKKILEMVEKSSEFDFEDERPMQYGRFVYRRKK